MFGIITMAESETAVSRACGLAASLDATGERIPRALLYSRGLQVPDAFFDLTIPMPDDPYDGRWFYLNKLVHPFGLTPFSRTLFLDSDVIVRRPITEFVLTHFAGLPVAMCVKHDPIDSTHSQGNHFTPKRFAEAFGTPIVQNPDGGGHMYFESGPDSAAIVNQAINFVTHQEDLYHSLSGNHHSFIADELALLAILTVNNIVLPSHLGVVCPVQHHDVAEVASYLIGCSPSESLDQMSIFHFYGRAKKSAAYWSILSSIPARWPV